MAEVLHVKSRPRLMTQNDFCFTVEMPREGCCVRTAWLSQTRHSSRKAMLLNNHEIREQREFQAVGTAVAHRSCV
jgi:hypothetical protein